MVSPREVIRGYELNNKVLEKVQTSLLFDLKL